MFHHLSFLSVRCRWFLPYPYYLSYSFFVSVILLVHWSSCLQVNHIMLMSNMVGPIRYSTFTDPFLRMSSSTPCKYIVLDLIWFCNVFPRSISKLTSSFPNIWFLCFPSSPVIPWYESSGSTWKVINDRTVMGDTYICIILTSTRIFGQRKECAIWASCVPWMSKVAEQ